MAQIREHVGIARIVDRDGLAGLVPLSRSRPDRPVEAEFTHLGPSAVAPAAVVSIPSSAAAPPPPDLPPPWPGLWCSSTRVSSDSRAGRRDDRFRDRLDVRSALPLRFDRNMEGTPRNDGNGRMGPEVGKSPGPVTLHPSGRTLPANVSQRRRRRAIASITPGTPSATRQSDPGSGITFNAIP